MFLGVKSLHVLTGLEFGALAPLSFHCLKIIYLTYTEYTYSGWIVSPAVITHGYKNPQHSLLHCKCHVKGLKVTPHQFIDETCVSAFKIRFCSFIILSLNNLIENYIYIPINWHAMLGADQHYSRFGFSPHFLVSYSLGNSGYFNPYVF